MRQGKSPYVAHSVVFAPEAQADLISLYDYLADEGDGIRALGYVERIQATCLGLAHFPQRGSRRDDIRDGLRVIDFRRRVTIAFHVAGQAVVIDRILYGGRDLTMAVGDP